MSDSVVQTEPEFTNQQIVMMLTHFSNLPYSHFVKDFLPYIKSIEHFHLTLDIYRRNPKFSWPHAASIASR